MKKLPHVLIICSLLLVSFTFFNGFDSTSHSANAGISVSGTLNQNETWTLAGSPYYIESDTIVPEGTTLTIEAGVMVKFNGFYGLYVNGDLKVEGTQFKRVTFTSNSSLPQMGDWYGIQINSSGHADVKYSEIKYAHYGIYLKSSGNNITNSIISYIGIFFQFGKGIYIENSSNNFISNNNLIHGDIAGTSTGIYLSNSSHNTVINNVVSDYIHGIKLYQSSSNIVANNSATCNLGAGIFLKLSIGNKIINNQATSYGMGIQLAESSNNLIADNNASDTAGPGGIPVVLSNFNTIMRNNINNNEMGIWMYHSSNNLVRNNNLTSNKLNGTRLETSSFNKIYHNNFISNTLQAYDDQNNNDWNDKYPPVGIGGNYWSDYLGIDDYCDPTQSTGPGCPDGFGDSPYIIDVNSQDNYPLMAQVLAQPDSIPPQPPTNIKAKLEGSKLANVNISWDLSLNDSTDVAYYEIFYSTSYDSNGGGYVPLASAPAGINYYVHQGAGEGDPNSYFYYVQAVDVAYNQVKNDTQVAKFTRTLTVGKQLISLPLLQAEENISTALPTLKFDVAWYYNSTDILDPWKSYNKYKTFNDLATVDRTMALWVNTTEDSNLTFAGVVPRITIIELKQGWNFVSYPSFIEKTVAEALSPVDYERVEGYDNIPPEYLKLLSDNNLMSPGYGYWLKVGSDTTWSVSN